MAKRGRKPTPAPVLKLSGTNRTGEPAAPDLPACPSWLRPDAAREWRRVIKRLAKIEGAGSIRAMDGTMLSAYCEAFADWREAQRILDQDGVIDVTHNGSRIQHPAVGIANNAWRRLVVAGQMFGLSPSARAKAGGQLSATGANIDPITAALR